MIRMFVETKVFKKLLDGFNDLSLERDIKGEILKNPSAGDVVTGTGGLRKIRVGKKGANGKSGGYRVLYLDLIKPQVTYLILIYDKTVQDNISPADKKVMKAIVEEIKSEWN